MNEKKINRASKNAVVVSPPTSHAESPTPPANPRDRADDWLATGDWLAAGEKFKCRAAKLPQS